MRRSFRVCFLVLCGLWLIGILLANCGVGGRFANAQQQVWVARGGLLLGDYYMPWKCAHEGYGAGSSVVDMPHCNFEMADHDRTYPAFAMLPHLVLPYSLSGAMAFTIIGCLVFLLSLLMVRRDCVWCVLLGLSAPAVFALERGNPIWFSAAAVSVFLSWWDDDTSVKIGPLIVRKSSVAAVCLSLAAVLKIAPALLGVLYLRRKRWGCIVISASITLLFLLVPFIWFGGIDGMMQFIQNASKNGSAMAAHAAFGFYPFVRVIKVLLGMDWRSGVSEWRLLTQVCGLGMLMFSVVTSRRPLAMLLAVVGMLFVPGNMMFYGGLYLIPLFLLRYHNLDTFESILWLVVLVPFQVPIFHVTLNHTASAAAVVLMVMHSIVVRDERSLEKTINEKLS